MHNYAHVCLGCRLSFKGTGKCPNCSKPLVFMGPKFKAPRRTQINQWRKVAMMVTFRYGNGIPKRTWPKAKAPYGRIYCSCGSCGHWESGLFVYKPRTLSDAKNQVHLRRNRTRVYA